MTATVYGNEITCDDCGSDNTVEKTLTGSHGDYPAVVCLRCNWSRSL